MGLDPAYEQAPIFYSKSEAKTPLTEIRDRIAGGEDLLSGRSDQEILAKLLDLLDVPIESQMLVYSKTSEQNAFISPQTPRAVYFSADAYVGWMPRGEIEVITFDEKLGMVFHMLMISSGEENEDIEFVRKSSCLSCHGSSATQNWPGVTVRSVHAARSGQPLFHAGTFRTDHSSPLNERWGGWYVTGDAGEHVHMGNRVSKMGANRDDIQVESLVAEAVDTLDGLFPARVYPGGASSDIVALMVLEHQVVVHNALVQGNLVTQQTLHRHREMRKAFGEPEDTPLSETNQSILDGQAEKIVAALLFQSEHPLEGDGVQGGSAFHEAFIAGAKRTADRRSLRDLRLYERMFKYRCSYLIHSQAFTHLPDELRHRVLARLGEVLRGVGESDYDYLQPSEREKILEILRETLPEAARLGE